MSIMNRYALKYDGKMQADERQHRLDLALAHAGINDSQLANLLGITRASMSIVRHGKSPMSNRWKQIADILKVSSSWLIDGGQPAPPWADAPRATEDRQIYDPDHGDYHLPTLGLAAAANGDSTQGTQLDEHPPIRIRRRWRGVKITGTSAEPIVFRGQTVIVDPAIEARPDCVVVIQTKDDQLLKRWVGESNGTIFLASLNAGRGSVMLPASELLHRPLVVVGNLWTDQVAR